MTFCVENCSSDVEKLLRSHQHWNKILFKLVTGGLCPIQYIGKIKTSIGSNIWEEKSYKNKSEIVFCYQNYSDLLWENIVLVTKKSFWKFEAEGWSRELLIPTVKSQNNFG